MFPIFVKAFILFFLFLFVSVPLKCNRVALALASVAKENEKTCLVRTMPLFFFYVVHCDFQ